MKEQVLHIDYARRINRVFEYIDEHLDDDLSLKTISEVAFFSPFHFHRVFKQITGETLNEFVTRRRIEKAALDILLTNLSATEIAHKYGFSDNSSLSKTFKKYFGSSPTEFKKLNPQRHSKIRQLESKNGQDYPPYEKYICIINDLKKWTNMNAKIEIKELPKMSLAYVSSLGLNNLEPAFGKIIQWATPKGLMNDETKMVTIYHDSFKVTESDKVRISAAMILYRPVKTEGEVRETTINAGKFIVGSYEITLDQFEKSWNGLFVWMNENGYQKADREPFEIYHNNFNEHPEKIAIVDFCIPIK